MSKQRKVSQRREGIFSTRGLRASLENEPVFLISIPLIFSLNAATYYYGLVNWSLIWPTLLLYAIVPVLIYGFLRYMGLNPKKTGISLLLFLLIFYFFHWWHEVLRGYSFTRDFARYRVQLPVLTFVCIIYLSIVWRTRIALSKWYFRINMGFIFILSGGLIHFFSESLSKQSIKYDQADPTKEMMINYSPCDTCAKPDIYLLIFDGYTSSSVLSKEFDYGNDSLHLFLKERGFFLADSSHSNYNFTHMSIASELNLNYLKNLDLSDPFYTKEFFESYYTIYHNELFGMLRKEGYSFHNFSIFPIADAPSRITPFLTELSYRSVAGQTFLNKLHRDIGWNWTDKTDIPVPAQIEKMNDDLKRLKETFDSVADLAKKTSSMPRFTYAHFIFPHETYYFDSSGKRLSPHYTFSQDINRRDYLQQLVFTNKFILMPLIDTIFRYSTRPFVVVLQGDHGYRNYPPEKINLEFGNLYALFWPDKNYQGLNRKLSSVNTFRLVLNHCFAQNFPLLKDSSINLMKVFRDEISD